MIQGDDRSKSLPCATIGNVPNGWQVCRLKRLAKRISSGKTPLGGSETYVAEGVHFLRSQNVYDEGLKLEDVAFITPEVDEQMSASRVEPGDILLNITGASIGRTCRVPTRFPPANVNQHVCVIRMEDPANAEFISWFLKAAAVKGQIDMAQTGAAREGLNFDQLGQFVVLLPPRDEQAAISNYLTQETARIDDLIKTQEEFALLLQERLRASVWSAVTKGLDTGVRLMESGAGCLGKIPSHWKVMPLRRLLVGIEQGWSPTADSRPAEPGEWGVIKLSAIRSGKFHPQENKALLPGTQVDLRLAVKAGDVLITRANTPELVGECCVVPQDFIGNVMLCDLVYRLTFSPEDDPRFISQYLSSAAGRFLIQRDARGSSMSMAKISQGHIAAWPICRPPLSEQKAIADRLDELARQHAELQRNTARAIELLKERRAALIHSVVTGSTRVPIAARSLAHAQEIYPAEAL